jgi:hypothetical protein
MTTASPAPRTRKPKPTPEPAVPEPQVWAKRDWLVRLGGARIDVINDVPAQKPKFAAIGAVMIGTSAVAAISAAFALIIALKLSPWIALPIGLGWGLLILNLDRMLILSMPYEIGRSKRATILLALPRVILALVIGIVVSTPITLQIFSPEIAAEVPVLQQQADAVYKAKLNTDPRFTGIPALQKRIDAEQATIAAAGIVDPSKDPAYVAAKAALDTADANVQTARNTLNAELDGSGGTTRYGSGPVAAQKRAELDSAQAADDQARANFEQVSATSTAALLAQNSKNASDAKTQLARDEKDLADSKSLLTTTEAAHAKEVSLSDGILERLTALTAISGQSWLALLTHLMIALLFIAIELLPVLVKTMTNLGSPTAYDELAQIRDASLIGNGQAWADHRRRIVDLDGETQVSAAEDRANRQLQLQLAVNKKVALAQSRALDRSLKVWSEFAGRRSERQTQAWAADLEADEQQHGASAGGAGRHSFSQSAGLPNRDEI